MTQLALVDMAPPAASTPNRRRAPAGRPERRLVAVLEVARIAHLLGWSPKRLRRVLGRNQAAVQSADGRWYTTRLLLDRWAPGAWAEIVARIEGGDRANALAAIDGDHLSAELARLTASQAEDDDE